MGSVIDQLKEASRYIENARNKLYGKSSGGNGFLGAVTGLANKGLEIVSDAGADVRDFSRDTIVNGWNSVPGNEFLEEQVGNAIDHVPFNNAAEASARALLGQEEIFLDQDALILVQNDPAMVAYQEELLSEIQKDPRFGNEAFSYEFDPANLEFGGQRTEGNVLEQIKDPLNPAYEDTRNVAKNELTWLLRHADVTAVANVDTNGVTTITYTVTDVLDLRPGEGRSDEYNQVTSALGTVWHDILGAEESTISGTWTRVI